MQHAVQVNSAWSTIIDEPPSCIAFCPTRPDVLVMGTYILHKVEQESAHEEDIHADSSNEKSQRRTGSLLVYQLVDMSLRLLSMVTTLSAILDIEWSPHHTDLVLGVATSTGSLEIYKLSSTNDLDLISSIQVTDPSTLVLDLVWHPTQSYTVGITLSTGEIQILQWQDDIDNWKRTNAEVYEVATHSLEPWTLAINANSESLYSGGDDTILQCMNIADLSSPIALWSDRKIHQAGLTAILPLKDGLLVTGSYDDHIRLVQAPTIGRRQVLAELNLGGGVWRLKLIRQQNEVEEASNYIILASCMHAGARVIELRHFKDENSWSFQVLARFEEHQSMNYGSDCQPYTGAGSIVVVSTSFYDRKVCVWSYSTNANAFALMTNRRNIMS